MSIRSLGEYSRNFQVHFFRIEIEVANYPLRIFSFKLTHVCGRFDCIQPIDKLGKLPPSVEKFLLISDVKEDKTR